MSMSVHAATAAIAAVAKTHAPHAAGGGHETSPAKQARAADPTARGAAFGALVSQLARARHAPAAVVPPVPPEPVVETAGETAAETQPGEVLDIVV